MGKLLGFFRKITQKRELQIAVVLAVIGGLMTTAAFVMAFTTANFQYHDFPVNMPGVQTDPPTRVPLSPHENQVYPPDGTVNYENPWLSQKIFYFHVPLAWVSLLIFSISAIFAGFFLKTRDPNYDLRSRIGMEATLIFTLGTMITGSMWTRASWVNSWGEMAGKLLSEPRLVTYSVMLMFVVAYFVLRRSVDGEEKKATYSAVFAILAWVIVPFSFLFTRMTAAATAHPTDATSGGMDPSNFLPFMIAVFGMTMLCYAIYILRMAEEKKRAQLDIIKEDIEDSLADANKQNVHAQIGTAAGTGAGTNQYSAAAVLGGMNSDGDSKSDPASSSAPESGKEN